MKKIIVIPKEKIKVLTSCGHFSANGYFTFEKEDAEVEQVPTNWEELKELCKDIKGIGFAGGNAKGEIIQLDNIWFAENGDIWGYSENWEEVCVIGKNRTPAQMWQIIKNLVGEE